MTPRSRVERVGLLLRTIRHLRPAQVAHRLRLRGQKSLFEAAPKLSARIFTSTPPTSAGWPEGFTTLDGVQVVGHPSAAENAQGVFDFVGERRVLGDPPDWEPADASQLWRYHLHYMEWAWPFAAAQDREWARDAFARLWRSWREGTVFGRWDAWSPYVVSLRAWAMCGIYRPLVAGGPDEEAYLADLARHARFIRANLEHDVGGNHLIKNLKGLLGTAIFLDDPTAERVALRHLEQQLAVQVLPDGGHYERSPSYHCQVLGDLIDIRDLLTAARRSSMGTLDEAIGRMRRWLGEMLLPDGDVPLLNDCTLVGEERLRLLEPTPPSPDALTLLGDSGYIVVRPSERVHLVIDVGPPCPPDLPAHAHADCLSFLLAIDGRRFLVDTGTSTYQAGPVRDHERSTRAHNTVEVGGTNQTEVWGAFRAGRRANPRLEAVGERNGALEVSASHDGYERLPGRPRHRRTWRITPGALHVIDEVTGDGALPAVSRLHLAPGLAVSHLGDKVVVGSCLLKFDGGSVAVSPPGATDNPAAWTASRFGERCPVSVIANRATTGAQARLHATITWIPPATKLP